MTSEDDRHALDGAASSWVGGARRRVRPGVLLAAGSVLVALVSLTVLLDVPGEPVADRGVADGRSHTAGGRSHTADGRSHTADEPSHPTDGEAHPADGPTPPAGVSPDRPVSPASEGVEGSRAGYTLVAEVDGVGGHAIDVPHGAGVWQAGSDPTRYEEAAAAAGLDVDELTDLIRALDPTVLPVRTAWVAAAGPDGAPLHVLVTLEQDVDDAGAEGVLDGWVGAGEVTGWRLPGRPEARDAARTEVVEADEVRVAAVVQLPEEGARWSVSCVAHTADTDGGRARCDEAIGSFVPHPPT